MLTGIVLHWRKLIDDAFIAVSSKLVFSLALPVLMFRAVATADMDFFAHTGFVLFALTAAALSVLLVLIWAKLAGIRPSQEGSFIQAGFRSNLGIVGLALCIAAYGDQGAALGALLLAVVTPLYNIASVWLLNRQHAPDWRRQFASVVRNPLILAIFIAAPFQLFHWPLPAVVLHTGNLLAQLALPLALIGVGGSLNVHLKHSAEPRVLQIVLLKLVLVPVLTILLAWYAGFRMEELGVLALMFASPTAAASFVMAKAMGGDALLTARAIAMTTLGSLFSVSGILYILAQLPLV